jgi:hypothetical protein
VQVTTRRLRRSVAFGLVGIGFAGAFGAHVHAASGPVDADLFAVSGRLKTTTPMPVVPTAIAYTMDAGTTCITASLPAPVSTSIPGFVDVPADESGACTTMTGSGTFSVAQCSTGTVSGDWQMTEPAGDSARFAGSGVMVGGVAIMVTPPSGTFSDDGSNGQGAAVALILPDSSQSCGSLSLFDLTAVVAGAY